AGLHAAIRRAARDHEPATTQRAQELGHAGAVEGAGATLEVDVVRGPGRDLVGEAGVGRALDAVGEGRRPRLDAEIRGQQHDVGAAQLIAGGLPPGSAAGHDHDYARLRLLGLLAEQDVAASVANDFANVEKWLPTSRLLVTYVAGPYPDAAQCRAIQQWLEAGGHWLAL